MLPFEIKYGTYTGTGAALSSGINSIGFKPAFIIAFNQTDGNAAWFHIAGQTAATAVSIDTEVAVETSACTLTPTGFTLDTNSVVNGNAKVYVYLAVGSATLAADGS